MSCADAGHATLRESDQGLTTSAPPPTTTITALGLDVQTCLLPASVLCRVYTRRRQTPSRDPADTPTVSGAHPKTTAAFASTITNPIDPSNSRGALTQQLTEAKESTQQLHPAHTPYRF